MFCPPCSDRDCNKLYSQFMSLIKLKKRKVFIIKWSNLIGAYFYTNLMLQPALSFPSLIYRKIYQGERDMYTDISNKLFCHLYVRLMGPELSTD